MNIPTIISMVTLLMLTACTSTQPDTQLQTTSSSVPATTIATAFASSTTTLLSVTTTSMMVTTTTLQESTEISTAELIQHNSESDCWVAYEGNVYDITDFLPKHPGSASEIIPYCGTATAFTNAFTGQHGISQVKKLLKEGIDRGALS